MDLDNRKYDIIQKLTKVTDKEILKKIEDILSSDISDFQKKELDKRIESFEKAPEDLLDWESFKESW